LIEIRIPRPGDAIVEGTIARWLAPDGVRVHEGQALYLLETEKVELEIEAPAAGVLRHVGVEGQTYPVGALVATIE
jgi:pyruvate/2-oxoglutarate dehydrogenase complex dihydrolipoamide acyltransferase (E2) component